MDEGRLLMFDDGEDGKKMGEGWSSSLEARLVGH